MKNTKYQSNLGTGGYSGLYMYLKFIREKYDSYIAQ